MKNRKGSIRAKELLNEIGFDEISDLPMDILVSGLGATLILTPLKNSDGKIIRGHSKTLIKINSEILFQPRKSSDRIILNNLVYICHYEHKKNIQKRRKVVHSTRSIRKRCKCDFGETRDLSSNLL